MKPKVMVVQSDLNRNKIENFEEFFKISDKNKCDFIVFPEYLEGVFLPNQYIEGDTENFVSGIKSLAKKYGVYVVFATLRKIEGKFYVACYLIDRKGGLIGEHRKIALEKYSEEFFVSPGKDISVFQTEFGKVGLMICRDLLYPEISKKLADLGARIIFCPSFWAMYSTDYDQNINKIKTNFPVDADIKALTILPAARAIENEVFFILSNSSGIYKSEKYFSKLAGLSGVFCPLHGVMKSLNHGHEDYLITDLNFDILEDSQNTFSVRKLRPLINHNF
jgi:omega-amidase